MKRYDLPWLKRLLPIAGSFLAVPLLLGADGSGCSAGGDVPIGADIGSDGGGPGGGGSGIAGSGNGGNAGSGNGGNAGSGGGGSGNAGSGIAGSGIAGSGGGGSGNAGSGAGGRGGGGPGGTPVACDAAKVAAFAGQVHAPGSECATVVRLEWGTYQLLGYKVFCGPAKTTDANAALAQATKDTGIPSDAYALSAPEPKDEYHFYYSSLFYRTAVVSVRNGLTVLGNEHGHPVGGWFLYPKSWGSADDLQGGCAPQTSAGPPTANGVGVPAEIGDPVLRAVWASVIPDGLSKSGRVWDAYVLSASNGTSTSPIGTRGEWVAIVNSGAL